MNGVRKHLSAIKGGRLAARVRGRSVTLVYSDVSSGALADVASGPTLADLSTKGDAIAILERIGGCDRIVARLRDESLPDTVKQLDRSQVDLIADNSTLTSAAVDVACEAGLTVQTWRGQIEMDVAQAAEDLVAEARQLREGELLVAGGELTVVVRGDGLGGRCSELAVRVAIKMSPALRRGADAGAPLSALFASSDGVDGNSGLAGVYLPRLPTDLDIAEAERELARSSSAVIAARIGEAIIIPATGNNLRDLFLLARG